MLLRQSASASVQFTGMSDIQWPMIVLTTGPNILAVVAGIVIHKSRLGRLRDHVDLCFSQVDRRFDEIGAFSRFELHRFEEVLDERLRHVEERG